MPHSIDDQSLEFPDLPHFPADVPTVPLLRISLSKLLQNDQLEIDRLWKASCELGFFYLDLTPDSSPFINRTGEDDKDHSNEAVQRSGTNGQELHIDRSTLLGNVDELFKIGEEVFELPVSEKVKYDFKSKGSYFGYKGYGDGVIDAKGTKDRNEFYNVSKDDILGLSDPLPAPDALQQPRPIIKSYMEQCHTIVTLILGHLNERLGLPPNKFSSLHRLNAISGDQLRWVYAPPQPSDDRKTALGEHTDFGSVTVLFNRLGGLQVLPPGSDGWKYVKPLRNHAVVNLGDAMVKFSAGILRSNIHRVVNPPGGQGELTRMSLVYFARPEDDITLKALDGSKMIDEAKQKLGQDEQQEYSAKDWILKRALGRRSGDFCLIPLGTPTASVSQEVAAVQRLLARSGLKYEMHSAGTTVEGSWTDVMSLIGRAHGMLHERGVVRIQSDIRVGSRTDKVQGMRDKVDAVRRLLADDPDGTEGR